MELQGLVLWDQEEVMVWTLMLFSLLCFPQKEQILFTISEIENTRHAKTFLSIVLSGLIHWIEMPWLTTEDL